MVQECGGFHGLPHFFEPAAAYVIILNSIKNNTFLCFYLQKGILFVTFAPSQQKIMKAYKVIEVIKLLEADGWVLVATKGDHRQYRHPLKKGKVTIRGHKNEVLS